MPRKKYFRFEREIEGQCATNWWSHEHFGNNAGASDKLYELFGCKNLFNNPKPVELIRGVLQVAGRTVDVVLDFFAGSGTTGHAVIELNREDGSKRKYLLVEMADYFNSVLLPRIKKAIYAPDWKSGKPVSREKGVTQLVKCVRLESYEDTLDCLVLTSITNDLLENTSLLEEDYKLRYALRAETADSACLLGRDFADPFSYTLSAARDGALRDVAVDLPETFNYLIGLRVETRWLLSGVLVFTGKDATGQVCLVLWRNLETISNKVLEDWFANNRVRFPESLDVVYINGDHTLNAIRRQDENWVAETIEPLFRELMFQHDER